MRKLLFALVALVAAMSLAPANAKPLQKKNVTFSAPVPCAVVLCSYWMPRPSNPTVVVTQFTSDADSDTQTGMACTDPISGVPTYQDYVFTAPKGAKLFIGKYTPTVDWDLYLCEKPASGNNGKMIANETVASPDECPAACPSELRANIKPGKKYVVRAYNFSDPEDLRFSYTIYG